MRCTADTMQCTANKVSVAVLGTYDAVYGISYSIQKPRDDVVFEQATMR